MIDKKKLHQILSSLWKNDDSVGKTYYNQALQDVQTAIDLQEEPISKDLEEAALLHLSKNYDTSIIWDEDKKCVVRDFKAGAKWQKERDENEIRIIRELLDNFDKTCDEYHDAGFKHGQEALMKDATEVPVHIDAGGYPYIPEIELYDYDKDVPLAKDGDKYKVVLIKEE